MVFKRERRSGDDRRKVDLDPPVTVERRRRVESRKPELTEILLSETEWDENFGNRRFVPLNAEIANAQESS